MRRIALAITFLSVLAIAVSWGVFMILGLTGLPFDPKHVSPISLGAVFGICFTYCGWVLTELLKLIEHSVLTSRSADRVALVVFGIRDRAIGAMVFFFVSALVTFALPSFSSAEAITNKQSLAVISGAVLTSLVAMLWLVFKHHEIGLFKHRLEQKKRADDLLKETLKQFTPSHN